MADSARASMSSGDRHGPRAARGLARGVVEGVRRCGTRPAGGRRQTPSQCDVTTQRAGWALRVGGRQVCGRPCARLGFRIKKRERQSEIDVTRCQLTSASSFYHGGVHSRRQSGLSTGRGLAASDGGIQPRTRPVSAGHHGCIIHRQDVLFLRPTCLSPGALRCVTRRVPRPLCGRRGTG